MWLRPSKARGTHQVRHALRPTLASEGCRTSNEEADLSYNVEMRTPEQTALIALRGLLEAKDVHIQKLQVGNETLTGAHIWLFKVQTLCMSKCNGWHIAFHHRFMVVLHGWTGSLLPRVKLEAPKVALSSAWTLCGSAAMPRSRAFRAPMLMSCTCSR